ncbi:MAG: hypothetical protein NXI31_01985 [bacterium]|nr:hypothetical protein [bacterium]
MMIPEGMQLVLQGKADLLREIAEQIRSEDIAVATGPLPGSS